jgi:methionine-rich copper-binding protein CopC
MALMPRFLVMLLVAVVLAPTAASAHSQPVETSPARGARLKALPPKVAITFDEPPKQAALALTMPDGTVRVLHARVEGPAVTASVSTPGPRGTYTLSYRVVSADGHPASGSSTFTVTSGSRPVTAPRPNPTSTSAPARTDHASPVPMIAVLGVVLVGLAALTLAARARRR